MKKTGLVGWRGMVGSVLMERMMAQNDFDRITPVFSPPPRSDKKPRMWEKKFRP